MDSLSLKILEKIWSATQATNEPNHSGNELYQILLKAKNINFENTTKLYEHQEFDTRATLLVEISNALLSDSNIVDECKAVLARKPKESNITLPKSRKRDYSGMRTGTNNSMEGVHLIPTGPVGCIGFITIMIMKMSESRGLSTVFAFMFIGLGGFLVVNGIVFFGVILILLFGFMVYRMFQNDVDND